MSPNGLSTSSHHFLSFPVPKWLTALSFSPLVTRCRTVSNFFSRGCSNPAHLPLFCGYSQVSYPKYGGPEQRFCPAAVYEYSVPAGDEGEKPKLVKLEALTA